MQPTADFHDLITDPRLPQAAGVVDDATALDAAVDVRDTDTAAGDAPISRFLRPYEGPAPRLAGRHDDVDMGQGKGQEPEILKQPTACGQGRGGRVGNALIVGAAGIGVTQKEDHECGVDQQHIFDRVALFLAAITARLLSRILGALDAPFDAIMPNRGKVGAGMAPPQVDRTRSAAPLAA
jgi:hypothetical protein